jgi:hypothetical protein
LGTNVENGKQFTLHSNKFIDIASHSFYSTSTALSENGSFFVWGECGGEKIRTPKETHFNSFHEIFAKYWEFTHKAFERSKIQAIAKPTEGSLRGESSFAQNTKAPAKKSLGQKNFLVELKEKLWKPGNQANEASTKRLSNVESDATVLPVPLPATPNKIKPVITKTENDPSVKQFSNDGKYINEFEERQHTGNGQELNITDKSELESENIGKISYYRNVVLGRGSHGTIVYKGLYENGLKIAVKRVQILDYTKDTKLTENEIKIIREITHHNIIRYYCNERDKDFVYIAMELAKCSLYDYIVHKKKYPEIPFDQKYILNQTCKGLKHLHSKNIIHHDLKPHNILLFIEDSKTKAKISDFGISKSSESQTQTTSLSGTFGWIAPECLRKNKEQTSGINRKARDIFSLGCVFHYVLTEGIHPFGEELDRYSNINSGKFDIDKKLDSTVNSLICSMIQSDPIKRPDIQDILESSLFFKSS